MSLMFVLPAALLGCPSSPAPQPQPTTTAMTGAPTGGQPADIAAPETTGAPSAGASAQPPAATAVTIHTTYTGRINVPLKAPGEAPKKLPPRIMRDARGVAELISMIPTKRIQKKQPAPPSDDPLLGKPDIDLKSKMVIAAFRTDTMYVHPKLENPRMEGDKLVIDVVYPPLGDTLNAAAQQGIGTYCAIVIDRFNGQIEVRER